MTDTIDQLDTEDSSTEDCVMCGKVLGVVGLVISAVFFYISVDVLSGGKLTAMLTRSTHE